ncbi:hypothetical protein XCR_1654 [Xanthomonas campestris pv. raphani 756C]|nr:hypothetical protein XCR_1654 [Xanthomonas campestris pv. raphani 756C]
MNLRGNIASPGGPRGGARCRMLHPSRMRCMQSLAKRP